MRFVVVVASTVLLIAGCNRQPAGDDERGAPPPPPPSAAPGGCRDGGGKVTDAASAPFFARQVAGYCLDPNGETRAYGKEAPQPLDQVCLEQFNGECEVYKGYGLDRVVTLRYVDGGGTTGEIGVTLARFATREGSYGFFTRRVIAGQDPAASKAKPLAAGGAGALGTGMAYVWRGLYVAQLSYSNTDQAPPAFASSSAKVLPPVAEEVGKRLTGELEPPRAVTLLPTSGRLPLGVAFAFDDVLDVKGAGSGALGYYAEGAKRWRTLAIVRPDPDGAEDIMKTFGKLPGAEEVEGLPFEAIRFTVAPDAAGPKLRWVVARAAERIVGVGDEPHVLGGDATPDEQAKLLLTEREQVTRLGELVKALTAGAAPAPSSGP